MRSGPRGGMRHAATATTCSPIFATGLSTAITRQRRAPPTWDRQPPPQPYIPDLDADQSRSHNSLSGISHHKAGNTDILEEAPMDTVKEYDARVDGKHRVTLRGARYDYYNVKELANGCYILEPRELTVPEGISSATLADMDTAVANARGGGLCPHRPLRFLGRARAVRHTHGHSGDGAPLEQSANQAPHEQGQQAGGPALQEVGQAPSRG